MIATAFLVMQFIISAKAGLVTAVDGTANVHVQEQVAAGAPISTQLAGRVEIQLNPGTFLRLDENSEVVFDSVELADIQVHILSGAAIIDCGTVEKNLPIHVTYGTETLTISKPGLYRLPENAASASLEDWSQQRSQDISAANARAANTDATLNGQTYQDLGGPYPLYPGYPIYPGGGYPYAMAPGLGSSLGSLSYYSPYSLYAGGGYPFYFYQPYPFVYYQPVVRPVFPVPVTRPFPLPRPTTTITTLRPINPVSRPMPSSPRPAIRGAVHGGHR